MLKSRGNSVMSVGAMGQILDLSEKLLSGELHG